MSLHSVSLQSPQSWGPLGPAGPKFLRAGIVFLTVYLALNLLTEWYDVDHLGITLWSPDNGLSLAVLIESITFAPFVFMGAVLVDLFVAGVQRSIYVTAATEFLLTVAYISLALLVRKIFGFNLRQIRLADAVTFLVFIPAAAVLAAFIYCTSLYILGVFPSDKLLVAMRYFWFGDTLGMITTFSAIISAFIILPMLKALQIVYHEELLEGTTYSSILRIVAALRILLFPITIFKFYSMRLISKLHNPPRKHDPLYFLIHKYYISKQFTLRQRVQIAIGHHEYELKTYDCEYSRQVYRSNGVMLWEQSVNNLKFTIVLIATDDNRHEGDLSVILSVNNTRLCRMSFCYIDQNIFGLASHVTMLISRNQTDRTPVRDLFDQCFRQNTPQFFCLAAVCGIALSNEFKTVLAIKHDSQIAYEETFDLGFRNSYTALWEKFDAVEIEQHVYMLTVPLKMRPLGSVDRVHRARARNRRWYWEDISQSARSCIVHYRIASKS